MAERPEAGPIQHSPPPRPRRDRPSGRAILPILLLALTLVALLALALTSAAPDASTSRLDQALRETRFNGAVLVARGGKVLLHRGYGQASFEQGVANTTRTKFRIASLTKPFTAAAVLLAQERALLRVDDPICRYLDDCPVPWQAITLRHLLTHTAGLPELYPLPGSLTERRSVAQLVALVRDKPLAFPPGDRYGYSNSSYVLLGAAIERAARMTWSAFLDDAIFRPLGMNDTGYDRADDPALPDRADGYRGTVEASWKAPAMHVSGSFAAGGLYSTVEDLYRWDRALRDGTLLSPASAAAMFAPHVLSDPRARLRLPNETGPRVETQESHYGFGWILSTLRIDERRLPYQFHGGETVGFSSCIARFPAEDLFVVALSNLEGGDLCNTTVYRLAAVVLA
jgi:CubicO group peptidase (beta-lactamase class C family)